MSALAPPSSQSDNSNGSSSQRAMRLKVLYTFDPEGKQVCLARWPQFVYTQVYYLNPQTPIGVVDLKTCLNSIASASPEIVALLDKDYSVYSYDYSEEDIPLQGLGMLSWIMGSGAAANGGTVQHSPSGSRLITGRVCSAQTGIFKSEKETLEVKMKLVPVPAIKQSDYINSMNVYNTLSKIIPGDFDASAWSAYSQANPGLMQAAANVNAGVGPTANGGYKELTPQGSTGQNPVATHVPPQQQQQPQPQQYQYQQQQQQQQLQPPQHMQHPQQQYQQQQTQQQHNQQYLQHLHQQPPYPSPPSAGHIASQPSSQPSSQQPNQPASQSSSQKLPEESVPPKKKARKRNPRPPAANANNGGKKKAPPPSVPSAASTPAVTPSDACLPASQPPPSESTFASPDLPRAVPVRHTNAHSPLVDIPSVETFANSPQVESTPVPGSSPPTDDLLPHVQGSLEQEYSPAPTSPVLPGLERSCQNVPEVMDLNTELDVFSKTNKQMEQEQSKEETHEKQEKPQKQESIDGDNATQTLQEIPTPHPNIPLPPPEEPTQSQETIPEVTIQVISPVEDQFAPASPSPLNDLPLPTNPSTEDKAAKKRRKYIRKKNFASDTAAPSDGCLEDTKIANSQTTSAVETSQAPEAQNKSKKTKTSSQKLDGEKYATGDTTKALGRTQGHSSAKERIEAQLRQAVEEGKMPNYCENCGAIETPTWRRVMFKEKHGDVERDRNILLCNPCGLWHATKKTMRPPELWDPKKESDPPKRPRNNRKRKASDAPQDTQHSFKSNAQSTQQMVPMSEPIIIEDTDDAPAVASIKRATTPGPGNSKTASAWIEAVRASQRRIQSSPVKQDGTSESPIELDLSPCPVRRVLFPRTPSKGALNVGEEQKAMQVSFDLPPTGKENISPTSVPRGDSKAPNTPKRRRVEAPERRTPTRAAALRSPYGPSPQKQQGTKTPQLSPTSYLIKRFLSGNTNLQNISSEAFDSLFSLDSEDVFSTEDMMPSSPPQLFGLYEEGQEVVDETQPGVWDEFMPGGSQEDFDGFDRMLGDIGKNMLDAMGKGR
ncbi:hypothetical protein BDZ91DRAFT_802991 [Kalaharituber pfeilii]|nr:hypothetical protein BDZ91DRAFT_802991 [Kalaharituber pfeilii]